MRISFKWLRLALNIFVFVILIVSALNYQTAIYLIYQGKGQLHVLLNTIPIEQYKMQSKLTHQEKNNIALVARVKQYSVDQLGYKPTKNFSTVYDQKNSTTLWVVTGCGAFDLEAYQWTFPIVGKVSYKGFFKKELAQKEYDGLIANGYDADLRSVSAWSTLGWFNDPLLSTMLKRSKGSLCNLLFHELFHATYYAPSSVNFNENMANFIAHKATQQFLSNDTVSLNEYNINFSDNLIFKDYMLKQITFLRENYELIKHKPERLVLKSKLITKIIKGVDSLPLINKNRYQERKKDIMKFKNAYLIDFIQYDSMQDSLEKVFNKIYKANIKKLVRDLTID